MPGVFIKDLYALEMKERKLTNLNLSFPKIGNTFTCIRKEKMKVNKFEQPYALLLS